MNPTDQQIDPTQLKAAVQWASQNSTDPRAVELQNRIQSGSLNSSMAAAGLKSDWGPVVTPPAPGIASETGANYMGDVKPAMSDFNDIAKVLPGSNADNNGLPQGNLGAGVAEVEKGGVGNVLGGVEKMGLGTAADAVSAIFAPIAAPIQTLLKHVGDANAANPDAGGAGSLSPDEQQQLDSSKAALTSWAQAHPDIAQTLSDAFTVGTAGLGSGALDATVGDTATAIKNGVTNTVGSVKDTVSGTASDVKQAVVNAKNGALGIAPEENALTRLSDRIAPKPTIGQAKQAMSKGLLSDGKPSGLLTKGGPGKIAVSPAQGQVVRTVDTLIPDHASMSDPDLYNALDDKITETAQNLKPQMEQTPIKPETAEKIQSDFKTLQKQQMDASDGTNDSKAIIKKSQSNFQGVLEQAGSNNMNDLWDAAKGYDRSVPSDVKNATTLSPEKLRLQKTLWLQNRAILRNAINDTSTGLGATSQQAFSDMRDMYTAQGGLLSKAKVGTVGAPSRVEAILQKPVIKGAAKVIGTGLTVEGAKKALTGSF